jgi:hypothetical protein
MFALDWGWLVADSIRAARLGKISWRDFGSDSLLFGGLGLFPAIAAHRQQIGDVFSSPLFSHFSVKKKRDDSS